MWPTAPTSLRPRKASVFGHPAVTELREIIDQKCRVTTARLDSLAESVDSADVKDLEKAQAGLQQLKVR